MSHKTICCTLPFFPISACAISVALTDKHLPVAFVAEMLVNIVVIVLMKIE